VVAGAMVDPSPPLLAHARKQTRQGLRNRKHSQPENDVYCLLSMLTISWRRKKKREADFAFPSLLRLARHKTSRDMSPSYFPSFFVVCWSFLCCFPACVISLSSFPRLLSFFKINLKNETSREESVCACPTGAVQKNKPKIEHRKKEKSSQRQVCLTETCPFREKTKIPNAVPRYHKPGNTAEMQRRWGG